MLYEYGRMRDALEFTRDELRDTLEQHPALWQSWMEPVLERVEDALIHRLPLRNQRGMEIAPPYLPLASEVAEETLAWLEAGRAVADGLAWEGEAVS